MLYHLLTALPFLLISCILAWMLVAREREIGRLRTKLSRKATDITGTDGISLVAIEVSRQRYGEGFSEEHDDAHTQGELVAAAESYARVALLQATPYMKEQDIYTLPRLSWPWSASWWKPSKDPVRNLVKAASLLIAEINRLQRKEAKEVQAGTEWLKARDAALADLQGKEPAPGEQASYDYVMLKHGADYAYDKLIKPYIHFHRAIDENDAQAKRAYGYTDPGYYYVLPDPIYMRGPYPSQPLAEAALVKYWNFDPEERDAANKHWGIGPAGRVAANQQVR